MTVLFIMTDSVNGFTFTPHSTIKALVENTNDSISLDQRYFKTRLGTIYAVYMYIVIIYKGESYGNHTNYPCCTFIFGNGGFYWNRRGR
jgi:hypothetical protein